MVKLSMLSKYYISRIGREALLQKKNSLVENLEKSTRAMGHSASLDNDLRENPEFMQLRTKVTYELPKKIAELEKIIIQTELIENSECIRNQEFNEVLPGMEVEMISEDGKFRTHSILGYEEGDPKKGIVSYLSPVGKELLHKNIGDEVELPYRGRSIRYEITAIRISPYVG